MIPTLDSTRSPLLVVHFPPVVAPAEVEAHFDELEAFISASTQDRYALVVDLKEADLLAPAVRQHAVARMRGIYPRVRGRVAGVAHVVASGPTLATITGILWLAPPPHPTLVTRSMEEAVAWALKRLQASQPAPA